MRGVFHGALAWARSRMAGFCEENAAVLEIVLLGVYLNEAGINLG
jgi:hypothetical protein